MRSYPTYGEIGVQKQTVKDSRVPFKAREYGCPVEFMDSKEDFYSKTGTRFTTPPSMADW